MSWVPLGGEEFLSFWGTRVPVINFGAAKLPAPELILLTVLEVVGGILLTYFVLGELPGPLGLVGASLFVVAVVCNGVCR